MVAIEKYNESMLKGNIMGSRRTRTHHSDYEVVVVQFLDGLECGLNRKQIEDKIYENVKTVSSGNIGKYTSELYHVHKHDEFKVGTPTALEKAFLLELKKREPEVVEPVVTEIKFTFRERFDTMINGFEELFTEMAREKDGVNVVEDVPHD